MIFVGVDIGSTTTEAVLLDENKTIIASAQTNTGYELSRRRVEKAASSLSRRPSWSF